MKLTSRISCFLLVFTSLLSFQCSVVSFELHAKPFKIKERAVCCLPRHRPRLPALLSSSQIDQAPDSLYGVGMDQNAMMEQDKLIAVDEDDIIIPNRELQILVEFNNEKEQQPGKQPLQVLSIKLAHTFTSTQPRGIAHRAFSVFLFNQEKKLLLTKRASTKITFPDVWTNTCCSHPLYDQQPNEVEDSVLDFPSYPGIKNAAIRKLRHELGIVAKDVPHEDLVFLKKFHYWAADTMTDPKSERLRPESGKIRPIWGEHEVDYVLFLQSVSNDINVQPNPEEISEYKYVSSDELQEMFRDTSLLWSPWFQGIMQRGGFTWWNHLDEICGTKLSKKCTDEIEFFDPPGNHYAIFNSPEHGKYTGVLSLKRKVVR